MLHKGVVETKLFLLYYQIHSLNIIELPVIMAKVLKPQSLTLSLSLPLSSRFGGRK